VEYPFAAENRRSLFGVLLDLIRNSRFRSRPHDELRREILSLEVEETATGWLVDHTPGRHDDHVIALALAAQHVAQPMPKEAAGWRMARPYTDGDSSIF